VPLFVLYRSLDSCGGSTVAEVAVTRRVARPVVDSGNLIGRVRLSSGTGTEEPVMHRKGGSPSSCPLPCILSIIS